nr:MAG TPA: hypothetical protein [Caudoviricetes sp.]
MRKKKQSKRSIEGFLIPSIIYINIYTFMDPKEYLKWIK